MPLSTASTIHSRPSITYNANHPTSPALPIPKELVTIHHGTPEPEPGPIVPVFAYASDVISLGLDQNFELLLLCPASPWIDFSFK